MLKYSRLISNRDFKSISKVWRPEYKFSRGTLLQKNEIAYTYKNNDRMHTIQDLLYYLFRSWKFWSKLNCLKAVSNWCICDTTFSDLYTLYSKSFKDLSAK